MAYSHVAHDCRLGDRVIMSNACQIAGEVRIDDAAVIGGGSLIHQFCHIGRNIMLQGGALVNKDIPPLSRLPENLSLMWESTLSVCTATILPTRRSESLMTCTESST